MKTIANAIAQKLQAMKNCETSKNSDWYHTHKNNILDIVKNGPSGSGIDCGTKIYLESSTPEKLVLFVEYHHMNSDGYYDGWTQHVVWVKASLVFGLDIRVLGKDKNGIKDYLYQVYEEWLSQEYKE